jgi:hypothetical protein
MSQQKRIENNLEILKTLSSCKKCLRTTIVQKGSKELVAAICECVDNLLNNNVPISDSDREKLHKYKGALRKLVKKSSLVKKKKILIQNGGFLQFLIPAAISALGGIISDAITSI